MVDVCQRGSHHDPVKTTSARSLRIAVGTVLLGLGGCTPSASTSNDGAKTPAKTETKVTDTKVTETVNEGPVDPPPKAPDPVADGGCQPPDCHINPGPNDDPKNKPQPEERPPEPPPPPDIKVNPGPEPTPDAKPIAEPEPKRVNTGPVTPSREH